MKSLRTCAALWLFAVALCCGCSVAGGGSSLPDAAIGSEAPGDEDAADAAALASLVQGYADRGHFMGAVLVSRRGKVLLDRGYGYANAEWEVPNTPKTKFRLGSISKQFTAAAILLLEEEGKLRTDDLLSKHLADLPPAWASITLHHLLAHTSGIPDVVMFADYPMLRTQPSPPEKTYLRLREHPLEFTPGEKFKYSNSGYVVLALVIERLTGASFDVFLQKRLLQPHGLADTGSDAARPLLKRRASGYVPLTPEMNGTTPPAATFRNADFIDMSLPTGGGSLYSTTGDLLRWVERLFGNEVLRPTSLAKMTTPNAGNYGYGLFVGHPTGRRQIGHGGSIHGFLSSLNYFPDSGVILVLLANLTAGQEIGQLAAELVVLAHRSEPDAAAPSDGASD
jgi:CubicO group peptidase (beta-lactamase class C family)